MLAWFSVWSEVQTCIWPSWCHCHSLSHAPVKSRLVLPFWYRLTQVVLEKRPLNGCSSSSSSSSTWTEVMDTCFSMGAFKRANWSSRYPVWTVPLEYASLILQFILHATNEALLYSDDISTCLYLLYFLWCMSVLCMHLRVMFYCTWCERKYIATDWPGVIVSDDIER